ncbi:hypothetical protein ACFL27_09215 [candidate division CSSED10-310 bacterium]|uniref:MotA/TolQ/ExbB proton channel domain-containing protein n=1 Tax=candidate division CSSED10-310 bacterium TaxID=2855610 RepID=A0ABV6YVX3_UNCC1
MKIRFKYRLALGRICYILALVNCVITGLLVHQIKSSPSLFDFTLYHKLTVLAIIFGFSTIIGCIAGLLTLGKDFIAPGPYLGLMTNLFFGGIFTLVFLYSTSSTIQNLLMSFVKTIVP